MNVHSVIHGMRHVRPVDVARMVLRNRRVCRTDNYLNCVTGDIEIRMITEKFSKALVIPEIAEPEAFFEWYCVQVVSHLPPINK